MHSLGHELRSIVGPDVAWNAAHGEEVGQTSIKSIAFSGVAPAQQSASFAGIEGRARIQPEAESTLALLMALGELHGRNLAAALMRSRVHNRTRDRGGKPIRLAWPWASPPVHPFLCEGLCFGVFDVIFFDCTVDWLSWWDSRISRCTRALSLSSLSDPG